MYLKSVEIIGFKSFADKIRIELKPGITGIIGPNGCGKTNVMEAVRWCLGEMSWKSLRSPSMVDVIFTGNAQRKALSMAEVTLTFDNSANLLPVQYTEITVTRRIFRSGESEYLLNKTPCRLKDIRELFLDTGIGGDGYAIIDQGGVDFVLNSKPEDRRSLFEEAAGVAKYRTKREEALRKLERVQADLDRLKDSIALISEQIKKLDSDARKAKLFQKYKEELTAQEVGQVLQEIAGLSAEMDKETALIEPVRKELEARRVEFDAQEGRLAAARLEHSQQQAMASEIHQRIAAVKAELGRLQERIANARKDVLDLRSRKEADLKEIEENLGHLKDLGPAMERARSAADEAEQGRGAAHKELDQFRSHSEVLTGNIAAAEGELTGLKERFTAVTQAVQDSSGRLDALENDLGDQISSLRQALKDLGRTKEQLRAACAAAEAQLAEELSQQAWMQDSRSILAAREAARDSLKTEISILAEEMAAVRTECAVRNARVETLQAQGGQDPYWLGAQAVLAADIPGVLGTLRSLIKVEPGFESYVEDALGERLYAIVCQDSACARTAVEFLEASQKGRARLLVLSSLHENPQPHPYPPQAKPLLERVRWDPRLESAAHYLLAECYVLGRNLYGHHWLCGGAESRETVKVQLADIGTLRQGIAELSAREVELAGRKAALDAGLARAEEDVRSAAAAAHEESARWGMLQSRRRDASDQSESLARDEELLTQEAVNLLRVIAASKEGLRDARAQLQQRRSEQESMTGVENEVLQRLGSMRAELAARRAQGEMLEKSVRQWDSQCGVLQEQCSRLAVQEESIQAAMERRRVEIGEIEKQIAHYEGVEVSSNDELEKAQRSLAAEEVAAQSISVQVAALQLSIDTLDHSVKALAVERDRLNEEVHRWELKAGELKTRRDGLKNRLWDEWQMTLDEAGSKYQQVTVDQEKIQTLRRRIQNMGNINLAAPEEYEALTQKHQFFLTQVEDLNKAKDDLRAAITKINSTTREHFRQTFSDVREHFQRIYAILFEGGEADLVLTDQENLLETGIDIVAQPPGKRLQSITLLSGGERTLTAIALLFAFFMVRPSPVCMLDEADAALDEANIGRFAAMLREFSTKSQFLIISHNKKTMAASDQIYGVTMEESGVSQLLAVDFQPKTEARTPSDPQSAAVETTPGAQP